MKACQSDAAQRMPKSSSELPPTTANDEIERKLFGAAEGERVSQEIAARAGDKPDGVLGLLIKPASPVPWQVEDRLYPVHRETKDRCDTFLCRIDRFQRDFTDQHEWNRGSAGLFRFGLSVERQVSRQKCCGETRNIFECCGERFLLPNSLDYQRSQFPDYFAGWIDAIATRVALPTSLDDTDALEFVALVLKATDGQV
jgi:hypothetical protein